MPTLIEPLLTGDVTGQIYRAITENMNFHLPPSDFVHQAYRVNYQNNYQSNPSVNGKIFEFLICEVLLQHEISPIYFQAKFTQIPNIDFDIICYSPIRPVLLSMKVSLRERYKQADLEALALKQVYRNARAYLLTLNAGEGQNVQQKIENGELFGLNVCVVANSDQFNELIEQLVNGDFQLAERVYPIEGNPILNPNI